MDASRTIEQPLSAGATRSRRPGSLALAWLAAAACCYATGYQAWQKANKLSPVSEVSRIVREVAPLKEHLPVDAVAAYRLPPGQNPDVQQATRFALLRYELMPRRIAENGTAPWLIFDAGADPAARAEAAEWELTAEVPGGWQVYRRREVAP